MKRKFFRWLIDQFDTINFWLEKKFNLNPKRTLLEKQQDMITLKELDRTIGKHLNL